MVDLDGGVGAEIGAAVMQIDDCSLIILEVAHNIARIL